MNAPLWPDDRRPARLNALPKLPVFVDLAGRSILVVGGSDGIAWKVELLAAAGGAVRILAEDPSPELRAVVRNDPKHLTLVQRTWREMDLAGVSVAIADIEDGQDAATFAEAARRRGALVNIVDQPAFCDFQFGTIVNRAPVIVSISTDGAAPILGQAIRRRIEAVLPSSLGAWAQAAKDFRDRLREIVPSKPGRRRFWERFVDGAFANGSQGRNLDGTLDRLAHEAGGEASARRGEVVIVGAGPGDPELLTLKAMRELQAADVIVYDRLVTPAILELARREARRVHVGKEGHSASCRQEDINALIVDLALAGECVVRLKGGDPAVFGRTGEEVAACRDAGVPVRIVPGITTASAAAASLNASLTHRDHAQRVQFITAHDRHGDLPENLNLAALADPQATTIVYMGRRTASKLATRMIESGLPPATPVVAISNVSRDDQENTHSTVKDVARGIPLPGAGPLIIAIGASVAAPPECPLHASSTFTARNGQRRFVSKSELSAPTLVGH
ncbi:siroheme synthase CysG [Microvirga tunisiensis]|uniref:Uroporphyrinogen-III C-methyltransferase n=2 Tax=Hyphomicrobiales TaxID=356 RepID=A0A5N7MGR4_9HYPH|nr:siroheme synthase CysG [Microvirga tunisiensis]MPR07687.1 uroporphyrinogen-III C-methyltransferase [Microvirga tunisiensis]MPR25890.1 uroporphyrinogen-III C-methyltransferase [Microvirga tunisiensis]